MESIDIAILDRTNYHVHVFFVDDLAGSVYDAYVQILLVGIDRNTFKLDQDENTEYLYAEDVAEAIQFLYHVEVDAIVVDLCSLSHDQARDSISSLKNRVDYPIIALVGDSETGSNLVSIGVEDFLLSKLLSEDLLRRSIRYATQLYKSSKTAAKLSAEVKRQRNYYSPFHSLFSHSPVGMVVMDLDGRLVQANRAMENLLGYSVAELKNQYLSIFIHPEDSLSYIENLGALQEGRIGFFETENRFYKKGNEVTWGRVTLSLLQEKAGKRKFIFGIVKDVSQWKKSEVDLQRAKELAEAMARTKSEFLANMSHEIRTPIHTVTGMTELLLETSLDMEQAEYADQIRFSTDVLLSLVNDILDFSKIEAGKLNIEEIDFDLYEMLENAVDLVILEAHKKNLEVILHLSPEVPHLLRGDPARLRQIVVNLFNNAVKFTPEGQILIFVEEAECTDSQSILRFMVKDTGIGIEKKRITHLFQSFSQADSSTTRKYGGTGLGLSISKSLAEMMGGRIGVESELGVGSTFWFTVVVKRQAKDSVFRDVPPDFFADQKVLLIDDNSAARALLRQYLEGWGCRVEEVENGEEGLERLRRNAETEGRFSLALVDLRMPGIDGWHVASEAHSDKRLENTRLILLTPEGLGSGEAKMKRLQWFDGYLSKPVKKRQLLSEIFRILKSDMEPELAELEALEEAEVSDEVGQRGPAEMLESTGARLLVVEDHEVNQQLFKTILEKLGHQVVLAEDGLKAIEAVQGSADESAFDLIFMDIQMPNMNGYDATRKLREMGIHTPIVAVTASALREEQKRAIAAGMNDCLTKPFKKKDLVPVLAKWLSADSKQQESVEEQSAATGVNSFNFNKAVEAFMGREDVVRSVLGSFIEKSEKQLAILGEALAAGDMERVRLEAHSIKGGAWNLEARPLGDAARALEDAACSGDSDGAQQGLKHLRRAYEVFKNEALSFTE